MSARGNSGAIAWGGLAVLAALIASAGCQELGEPSGAAPEPGPSAGAQPAPPQTDQPPAEAEADPAAFACDPATPGQTARLKRLTMTQYRNTVRDLVELELGPGPDTQEVVDSLALDALPHDRRERVPQDPHGSYRRLDQALEQVHVDGAFRVGNALATALVAPDRLSRVVGPCASDADPDNDEACLSEFILRFGARVLRRPLDDDEQAFYREVYGATAAADPEAYAAVIAVMLNAPQFLYFVEHGDEPPPTTGAATLSAHELASRLSYHFLQSLPDAELWAAAQDGSLLQPAVLQAQVERLADDPRTRETMRQFFADWLKVDDAPVFDRQGDDPVYAAFAGDDMPSPGLRQQMIDDVIDMVAHYTWSDAADFETLFTSERSFARDTELAAIYGAEPWDGTSAPPPLPPGERPGLLTRALFLANGSANTRPIMKGVFLRRTILCDTIPPPPDGANAVQPMLRSDRTTRQEVEDLTEQPGSQCASCHTTMINPLGFALEGFDALGRFRTEQRLFDAQGTEIASLPVDTASVPRVTPGDDAASSDPHDLVQLMLDSGKLEACFARHYFRFTYGRWEDPVRDGCALERLRERLVETGSIAEMLKEAALSPEFRQRIFD